MADDRRVRKAEDGDVNAYTIENVHSLNKVEVNSGEYEDVFDRDAEFVKGLSGVRPGFKRKVTNELRKHNRSADGETKSKQIDESALTGYDALGVVTPPHSLESLAAIYGINPVHYAAINAKVDNIVGLGYKLVETTKVLRKLESLDSKEETKRVRRALDNHRDKLLTRLESMNEEESLVEILIKVWIDYEAMGNGYLEIIRKLDGTIGYIGHVPAQTIRVRRQRDGFIQISGGKMQFFRNFGTKDPNPIGDDDSPGELLHIKKYSPANSYYGVPDILSAEAAVAGMEFASRYNLDFFENKAIPRHLITLKGAKLGDGALNQLLSFFETGLKGQNHRSLFIPLPADDGINKVEFKIEPVDAKIQESSFDKFDKSNQAKILMAHRVPISKVNTAEGASLAIARDADKTFKEQVCGPRQTILQNKINRIIKEFTDSYEFKLNEMTLTDENTQSQIDERRRKTGTETANEQRLARGQTAIEGGDELFDMNGKKENSTRTEVTANRQRDADRTANASDSAGESRQPKGDGRATP